MGDQGCWCFLRQLWYQPVSVLACEEIVEWLLERDWGGTWGERVSPVKVSGAEGSKLGQFPQMEKPAAQMPWLVFMPPSQRAEKCEFILLHRSSEGSFGNNLWMV